MSLPHPWRRRTARHVTAAARRHTPAVWWREAAWGRRGHACAVVLWVGLIVPTLLFWSDSVLWIALMSIWANIAAHGAGATRR